MTNIEKSSFNPLVCTASDGTRMH